MRQLRGIPGYPLTIDRQNWRGLCKDPDKGPDPKDFWSLQLYSRHPWFDRCWVYWPDSLPASTSSDATVPLNKDTSLGWLWWRRSEWLMEIQMAVSERSASVSWSPEPKTMLFMWLRWFMWLKYILVSNIISILPAYLPKYLLWLLWASQDTDRKARVLCTSK